MFTYVDLPSWTLAFHHKKKIMPQIIANPWGMRAIVYRPGSNLKLGAKPSLSQWNYR